MEYIALICARANSKGLPGKNIKHLGGIPLIAWSINIAKKINRIKSVIVSTDSVNIAKISKDFGAEVPFIRPSDLAQDNSPEWLVWRHALDYLKQQKHKIDALVVIPPTSPLRSELDILNCLDEFEKNDADIVITVTNSVRSPYFNMVKKNKDGFASLVVSPDKHVTRRQDSPEVFDITTVAYVVKPNFVLEKNGIFDGKVRCVNVPAERSVDIDTILDFEFAEFINSKNESTYE